MKANKISTFDFQIKTLACKPISRQKSMELAVILVKPAKPAMTKTVRWKRS